MTPDFPAKPLSRKAQQRVEVALSRRYRMRRDEDPVAAVRRIAHGRVAAAIDRLRDGVKADAATAIHDTRKDLKKLRSLLRLVRDGLGEQRYRTENARYRDAARLLSGARDAEVKLVTLTALRERYPDEAPDARDLQDALEHEREQVAGDGAALDAGVGQALDALTAGAADIDRWSLDGDDFELMRAGLERAYRRGRKGLRAVRDDPTDEAVHEWRKRVKDLWYQLRLLQDAWPAPLGAAADAAHELADLLGDHHDLSVLVADARDKQPEEPDTEILVDVAERRQAELLDAALQIGDRLYAEKPSQFTRRIGRYWESWRRPAAD